MVSDTTLRWPNFLIIGTARSSTTSLHEYLGKHPAVFTPLQKEPCFFTFYGQNPSFTNSRHRYLTQIDEYLELFKGHDEKMMGESSTPYMYFHQQTIANIKKLLPDYKKIKILVILRNPAERAYSAYMHNRRDLREALSFEEAIKAENERKKQNRHFDFFYVDKGFYYEQVKAYIDNFDHVKILFYDDMTRQPEKHLNEIFKFLGVDPSLSKAELQHRNKSGEMKVKWFKKIITTRENPVLNAFRKMLSRDIKKKLRNSIKSMLLKYNLKKTEMDKNTRRQLIELYRDDINKLSALINKDLSNWLV